MKPQQNQADGTDKNIDAEGKDECEGQTTVHLIQERPRIGTCDYGGVDTSQQRHGS
jgi:hypothetical protein